MTFLIKINHILSISLLLIILTSKGYSVENKILYKVNNEIITSFDLRREFRYLALINKNILNLKKNEIFEISKNSIIREKIKKIEILNHIEKINIEDKITNELIEQNYLKLGFKNLEEFNKELELIGFNIDEFKEKIIIEVLWNKLIYEKFFSKVKLNEAKLKKEILEKEKVLFYHLSEIVFNVDKNDNYESKLTKIKNEISRNGFDNAALLHSISDSKSKGGDLGWINENSINKNLNNKLKKLKVGEFTQPEVIQGGFLILKLKDLKTENISLDVDKELEKLIIFKTNQQLNRFSTIYLNKIKKDIIIEKV